MSFDRKERVKCKIKQTLSFAVKHVISRKSCHLSNKNKYNNIHVDRVEYIIFISTKNEKLKKNFYM